MTGRRPDHRVVLDNLHLGWPAETVTAAQDEYDARLRAMRPDDPGVEPYVVHEWAPILPAGDRRALRAPAWPFDDDDDAGDGVALAAMIVLAAVLMTGIVIGALLTMGLRG